MTTPSLTNPNPKREDERVEKGKRAHHAHALELAAARLKADARLASADSCLNAAAYLRALPSPADPVRAAISEAQLHAAMDAFYPGENWRVDLGCALESSLRDMKSALRAALSVSTPTGEGEVTGTQTVPDRMSVAYWHRLQADELQQRAGENDTAWIMRLRQHFASSESEEEKA